MSSFIIYSLVAVVNLFGDYFCAVIVVRGCAAVLFMVWPL